MKIFIDANNSMGTNSYLVCNEITKKAYIIDASSKIPSFKRIIDEGNYKIEYLLLTHGHYDHIVSAKYLKELFDLKIVAHIDEKDILNKKEWNLSPYFGENIEIDADIYLDKDKGIFEEFEYVLTPGHTKGHICFVLNNIIFSGDTLFEGSIGRTDFPTGNYSTLINSIINILGKYDENSIVYPGHGKKTILGYELKNNPFLR